jgi:hypothetical protein
MDASRQPKLRFLHAWNMMNGGKLEAFRRLRSAIIRAAFLVL